MNSKINQQQAVIFCIISVLLATNVFALFNSHKFKVSVNQTFDVFLKHNATIAQELNSLQINFHYGLQDNNTFLSNVEIKDSLHQTFALKSVFRNGQPHILVCRFTEYQCESCVESALYMMRKMCDSIGVNNVLFLGTFQNNRIFNQLKPTYKIHNLQTYNTVSLNLSVEELTFPYYFVLDKELQVTDIFVPDKALSKLTYQYLQKIKEKYF